MTPSAGEGRPHGRQPLWKALHTTLLPDYNRKAAVYWWSVVLVGCAVLAMCGLQLAAAPPVVWLHTLLGACMAMLAGFFPVRIPRSKISFVAGEIFLFLLLLIHGVPAAVLAAAAEAAVGSFRTSKRWSSRIASPMMAGTAMMITGSLLSLLQLHAGSNAGVMIVATMVFAVAYFFVNTMLITTAPRLKRNESVQWRQLFGQYGWVGVAYAGSAALSALLTLTYQQSGGGVLMAMIPLLGMMLATLHYFFRQQEADEAIRQASAEAAERERELAGRHVRELEASERRFHSAFTHASIGMALLGFEGNILQANPALCTLVGHSAEALTRGSIQALVLDEDRLALEEHLGLVNGREFEGFALELRFRHISGEPVWVAAHCSFFSEPGASSPCLILQVQDITARRKAEQGLHHIAFHDALTGLPNRRRFHELLSHAVQAALKDPAEAFAVMFLDFDRFKLINDSLGHNAGDEFLVQVSARIRECLRQQDVVARLGGDEFAVLVGRLEHERAAVALADRLMDAMRRPFHVVGTELMTSASVGITFSALGYTNPEDVLRDADTAMYKAKGAGKARYALFDASLHTEVANRLRLEGDLRHAIDEGRLTLAYQPLFDLMSDPAQPAVLAGFEALVRWRHPQDGAIDPGRFLPIAEEAGLMLKLTDYVMHCACRQLRAWQQSHPGWGQLTINVNVSGHDIANPAFLARVTRAIVEAGLQPRHLCIELNENILMSRLEGALPVLTQLQQLGVGLAIDDFGTGSSSLGHLSALPIDCLKIDRSFVASLQPGSKEAAVVKSIVLLGSALGKAVVAEGIETLLQLEQLRDMGCHHGQGFLLGRPLPAAETTAMLQVLQPPPNSEVGALAPASSRSLSQPMLLH